MKKHLFLILFALACTASLYAQKKIFVRDYTYQASEDDSRNSARANATTQMRNILLSEVGQYLHVERTLKQDDTSEEFSQKIEAITAGIVDMKTLDEQWDGVTYYIKAEMAVDPAEVNKRIAEVLNDKQKTQELEEARKRTLAAEAEAIRLKKELDESKNEQQRLALQTKYRQTTDALSAEEYFTRGKNADVNGFYELAIEYYQQAISLDPNYENAYRNMNRVCVFHAVLVESPKYPEVIRYYQQVIAINPNNAMTYLYMGDLYDHSRDYAEAVRCYKKALAIDPNVAAYGRMGDAYAALKNYDEAMRYWEKVKDFDTTNALSYIYKGDFYLRNSDYNGAIWCFQKAIAIDPNEAKAYGSMGSAYRELKNYAEAIWCYQKAIALDPNDKYAYSALGATYYYILGEKKEGIKNLKKAAQLGHESVQETLRKEGYSW
jgi:superkiller protein 3